MVLEKDGEDELDLSCENLGSTTWFKYDRDYLYVNTSQFVPVILNQLVLLIVKEERNILYITKKEED